MERPLLILRTVTLLVIVLLRIVPAYATEYMVSSAAQIAVAMHSAQPGDILTMTNGTWTNQRIEFAALGTAGAPITLRAQTPGQVVLNGNSKVKISGAHLIVDGLRFDGGALAAGDHIVEFRGSRGEAVHSRFTNSAIVNYNPASVDTRYFWVSLYGQSNRVDHNRFEGQNHSGVTAVVWRDSGPDNHLIDANHFLHRPVPVDPDDPNGFETIRIGDSSESLSNSFTTVQSNLFERVDGEIEIISNKSGGNIYRYNTFRESAGTLTLRHGNDNRVEGNFFLGANKSQTGGIRVIGERQTIVNNYIAGVDDRAGGAISISAGVPDSELHEYSQVKDAVIAHNTLVNVTGNAVTFDDGLGSSGRTLLAQNVTVANNIFRSNGPVLFEGMQGAGWIWEGNIASGGSLGSVAGNPGVSTINPQMVFGGDGLWRPAAGSPAVNGAVGSYAGLTVVDLDGQPRDGLYDVGADEFSFAPTIRGPLTAADVGPAWLRAGFAAADFNASGAVDGSDLALWRSGFGGAGGRGQGDANADGLVDGSDFLAWQRELGASGAAAATATVPEANSAVLFVVAALALWRGSLGETAARGRVSLKLAIAHPRDQISRIRSSGIQEQLNHG